MLPCFTSACLVAAEARDENRRSCPSPVSCSALTTPGRQGGQGCYCVSPARGSSLCWSSGSTVGSRVSALGCRLEPSLACRGLGSWFAGLGCRMWRAHERREPPLPRHVVRRLLLCDRGRVSLLASRRGGYSLICLAQLKFLHWCIISITINV